LCRASAAAQKAHTVEAKRAATAEAALSELRPALAAAKDAAADATAACKAAKAAKDQAEQQCQRLQQQVLQLQQQGEQLQQANKQLTMQRQQLQQRLAECEQALVDCERCCAAAVLRAESAEAELSGIQQDVAEWSELHVAESCELQQTRQKLADAEIDLGVALQRMAAVGLQTRLRTPAAAVVDSNAGRPASAGYAGAAAAAAAAAAAPGRPGSSAGSPNRRRDGHGLSKSNAGAAVVSQQLPVEVTRQLQWQASEVVRLTGQLQQLQVRL
jgi:predicted  nucleic acid-binding Zn-ribbon protein